MHLDDAALRARLDPRDRGWESDPGLRDAAVLVPLVRRGDRDVLVFTLRRADLAAHAGQISFPGGGREPGEDPIACALREAEEEIGLAPPAVDVLGRLPDRVSIAGFLVAPVVGRIAAPAAWRPLPSEVAEVFELPVAPMFDETRWSWRPSKHPLAKFPKVPALALDGRDVWGLTGIVLRDLLERAR